MHPAQTSLPVASRSSQPPPQLAAFVSPSPLPAAQQPHELCAPTGGTSQQVTFDNRGALKLQVTISSQTLKQPWLVYTTRQ